MAKINDTTDYANTTPADADHVVGTDVSNTTNDANGETVTFLMSAIRDFFKTTYDTVYATIANPSFTGDITLSDATPTITLTDTTDSSDSLIAYDAAALDISVDENNEAASSEITFSVDGTELANINPNGIAVGGSAATDPADATHAFKVVETGASTAEIRALSSGAGNSDHASLDLNSTELGHSRIALVHDGTVKGYLGYDDANENIFLENYATSTPNITFSVNSITTLNLSTTRTKVQNSLFSVGPNTDKTIATGALTIAAGDTSNWAVDTESAASTDDLDTINGGATGDMLFIRAKDNARTVVLKDGTGNLKLSGDLSLTHTHDQVLLFNTGTVWREVGFGDNTT
jgi:hypothetical protein